MKRERRWMGNNKRRRARGINSGSSQFRVTPQLIVQVRWSQVSSLNRRPLGITAVTEQLRPRASPVFHQPASALSKHTIFILPQNNSSRQNVTLLIDSVCLKLYKHFTTQGFFIFGPLKCFHLILSLPS